MSWRDISITNLDHQYVIANNLYRLWCKLDDSKTTLETDELFASWADYKRFKYLVEHSDICYDFTFNVEEIEIRDEHYSLWYNKLVVKFKDDKKIIFNCEGKFTWEERQDIVLSYAEEENKRLKEENERLKLELSSIKGTDI